MNIIVCIKHVPDATGNRRFTDDFTVDRVGVDGLLSELDEYAMEQALRIKEARADEGEVTVIALTVGPEKAADALRKALQMGADQGVHVMDDAIAGSDAIATSLVLSRAVAKVARWRERWRGRPRDVRHGVHGRVHERRTRHVGRATRLAAGDPRRRRRDPGCRGADQA